MLLIRAHDFYYTFYEVVLETYLVFIDLHQAYYSVPKMKIWKALQEIGSVTELIEPIRELYIDNKAKVRVGKDEITIYSTKGLRQRCLLTPMLYNIYLERCLKA